MICYFELKKVTDKQIDGSMVITILAKALLQGLLTYTSIALYFEGKTKDDMIINKNRDFNFIVTTSC